MSLLQAYMEPCQLIEKKRVPDGEGGFTTSWTDGAEFNAAVVCDQSMQARAAEKQGVTSLYTVTCEPNGDDVRTPKSASFQFSQVTAEEWELTT